MNEIISNIINMIMNVLNDMIPVIEIESSTVKEVEKAIETISSMLGNIAFFFPVRTAITILFLTIGIIMIKFTMFIVNWIIKRIRGG